MSQALRKIAAAAPGRGEDARARQRFYLDPDDWRSPAGRSSHLAALQQAVWDDRRVDIAYPLPSGPLVEQRIEPYGLVAKAGGWWVVTVIDGRFVAYAVVDLAAARLTGERFERPARFDLREAWEAWCAGVNARPRYQMTLRVDEGLAAQLGGFGIETRAGEAAPAGPDGRVIVEASCDSFAEARARILALGRAVEVAAPEPLRRSVLDYAEQIVARYRESGSA